MNDSKLIIGVLATVLNKAGDLDQPTPQGLAAGLGATQAVFEEIATFRGPTEHEIERDHHYHQETLVLNSDEPVFVDDPAFPGHIEEAIRIPAMSMLVSAFDLEQPWRSSVAGLAAWRGLTVGLSVNGEIVDAFPEDGTQIDWANFLSTAPDHMPALDSSYLRIPNRAIVAVGGDEQAFHIIRPEDRPPPPPLTRLITGSDSDPPGRFALSA